MSSPAQTIGPLPTPIPAPPEGSLDWLTAEEWETYMSLIDAVLPPIVTEASLTDKRNQKRITQEQFDQAVQKTLSTVSNPPSFEKVEQFLKAKPSDIPECVAAAKGGLLIAPDDVKKQLKSVLKLLGTRPGSLFLTGYCTPVKEQPVFIREQILQKWSTGWMASLKGLAKSIVLLAQNAWVSADPSFAELSGYTPFPKDYTPGPSFKYDFMQFDDGPKTEELETDVVIVGSGCGGSVCAQVLAEAGHRVIVVDKGYYFPPSQLPMTLSAGPYHLYENNGLVQTDNDSAIVVAGSCWGGGGTVNWSVGLQTQDYVREEWSKEGLPFFTSPGFQESLDRVCHFMGVGTDSIRHTHSAQALLDGAKGLGWEASVAPQNTGGAEHYCGHCHYGCGSNVKQGPATRWLPNAARNGAKFIEGFSVDKVMLDHSADGRTTATGIVGSWTSRNPDGGVGSSAEEKKKKIVIKAKKVIVSSGSLNTPLILLRSGLKNPNIGKNLHIHPCNFVAAYFKEEVRCWEGGIITSLCTSLENLDGKGHGVKLETTCGLPTVSVALQPWQDGLTTKLNAVKFRHMGIYIALTRDRDTGRVYPDPTSGKPRIDYSPSAFDASNAMKGVIGLSKILYVAGATELHPSLPGVKPFVRDNSSPAIVEKDGEINDPAFAKWLDHVQSVGNTPPVPNYASAHQMGSCRMSSSKETGVVNPRGQVWETDGLFIADASVFPSASGVNPMVTNMAIADMIARAVSDELQAHSL